MRAQKNQASIVKLIGPFRIENAPIKNSHGSGPIGATNPHISYKFALIITVLVEAMREQKGR
jgi:hypothetical protein